MKIEIDYSPPSYYFGYAALTERSYKLLQGCCSGRRIVDLGCGSGELLRHLTEAQKPSYAINAVGIDPHLERTTADKSKGWLLSKSRWQDHKVGRLIAEDTTVILSWPANTLDSAATASLFEHLRCAGRIVLIGSQTSGSVVGNKELWEFFTRRNLEQVIRHRFGCQFVAVYDQSNGLPGKRGLPLVARYQEERCGITDAMEDWAV